MTDAKTKTGMANGSQMRITPEERELIARTFGGNERLTRLMRKIFLPEIDPNAPVGQIIDLWLVEDVEGKTPEEAVINFKARKLLITSIEAGLMQLEAIARMESMTPADVVAKVKADSSQ